MLDASNPAGEGGFVARDGLCTIDPCGRIPVAIIGGTGYVGRLLARRLLSHPTMCLGPVVGSKLSEGMSYEEVWAKKEAALMKNYGQELWTAMPFPEALHGVKVSSLDELIAGDCKVAVSCVAPEVGYIEDIMVTNGIKVLIAGPAFQPCTFPRYHPWPFSPGLQGIFHLAVQTP